MKYLSKGDVITFMDTVEVKVSDLGDKPRKALVHRGEIWEAEKPMQIEVEDALIWRAPMSRRLAKRSGRYQTLRSCAESFASLEWPDTSDPVERDLERRLEERTASIKARLGEQAAKLKTG